VFPRPPFGWELTEAQEIAGFEALKPRLAPLWNAIHSMEEEPYTTVVVPSMTLDPEEVENIPGATFYEERLLFLLIRLRNPRARMVYVTSQPVHPMVLDYYLQFLAGVPASHARTRLTMLAAHDGTPRPLTEKILERPRLIQRIRASISDPQRAYLTVFNGTPLERRLAVLLDIPMNGLCPSLCCLGTKSGSRKVFREAEVPMPAGFEDLTSEQDAERALGELQRLRPGLRRAVVKLNEGFSGEGNALVEMPSSREPDALRRSLHGMRLSLPTQSSDEFLVKLSKMGGVAEEFLEAAETTSPSAQLRVSPSGETLLISTHDQVLGGNSGQVYLGCRFPAASAYRIAVQDAAMRVGEVLARKGVVSRFGVDFLASRAGAGAPWALHALEINLRMGGTTHPFLALRFLIDGGSLDLGDGLFRTPEGLPKFYRSTDNLQAATYRGLTPEELFDIVTVHRLHYNQGTGRGVLFHMLGALSEHGKVGLTAIGNSREDAESLYRHTLEMLNRESLLGHPPLTQCGEGHP
jgi:PGM1 C-terminal domain